MREPPVPHRRECCLFLDVDGTLLDIAPTPDAVQVDESLRALLRSSERACGGAVALVSGRTIADIDELFEPLFLPVAGMHGCERRDAQGYWRRQVSRSWEFLAFRERLCPAAAELPGVVVEDKDCGLSLHYRAVPHQQASLRAMLDRLATWIPDSYEILDGDHVIEVKPRNCHKGSAIESFLGEAPFAGRFPIFIGDDQTDLDGFEAVRKRGGLAVAVGNNVESEWHLENPEAVRRWLASLAAAREAA